MNNYLISVIEDMMQEKFRLDITQEKYIAVRNKIREKIIDLEELIKNTDEDESKEAFHRRQEKNRKILEDVALITQKNKDLIDILFKDVYFHLLELSNNEINNTGFITHIITSDDQVDYDKETKIVSFTEPGKVEIPIATTLRKWTDATQIRIVPKKERSGK